jgi:hypothetical protein
MKKGRKGWLIVVGAAGILLSSPGRAGAKAPELAGKDKLFWEAARALYGEGLEIKRTRRSTTIAPGSLTQAAYDRYVKEVYLEVLRAYLTRMEGGYWRWNPEGYRDRKFDPRGEVKLGHLLMEPYLKYALCRKIAGRIGSKPNIVAAWRRYGWCALKAMEEATAPIYVYRGQKVTWSAPADRGDLGIHDVIWQADARGSYPMVVTVAGGSKIYTLASTKILMRISKDVDPDLARDLHAKASRIYNKTLKIYHGLVKREARKQRRLAGGQRVIFSDRRFYATVAQPPAKGPIPCRKTHFLAYAPQKQRKQGYHLAVEIDGSECAALYVEAGEDSYNDIYTHPACSIALKPGHHKVRVAMHESVDLFNHKRREWRRGNMQWKRRTVTYTQTRRGKLLYKGEIECTHH